MRFISTQAISLFEEIKGEANLERSRQFIQVNSPADFSRVLVALLQCITHLHMYFCLREALRTDKRVIVEDGASKQQIGGRGSDRRWNRAVKGAYCV